ncbi:protamine-like protein [Entelurus aequoreus]|uniref:protamine-like protein n=1 Tax=Entelurus aequoreus TaxID=161455 RepID=UPI002B1D0E3C|nr:protamine-like protein [Entelurus aequoreus]
MSSSLAPLGPRRTKKRSGPTVSTLILNAVSSCEGPRGVSLVALKKVLKASGYDVIRNRARIRLTIRRLVTQKYIRRTRGKGVSGSFKINRKAPARRGARRGRRRRRRRRRRGRRRKTAAAGRRRRTPRRGRSRRRRRRVTPPVKTRPARRRRRRAPRRRARKPKVVRRRRPKPTNTRSRSRRRRMRRVY